MNKLASVLITGLALAGCTMAPKYERPEPPVAASWPSGPADVFTNHTGATDPLEIGWREFFDDPRLQELIGLALTNNRDLRIAVLNVEALRQQHRIQRSLLFPSVDGSGSMVRQRLPADISGANRALTRSQYSVSAGVTAWEIDLFGRVRSLKDQVLNQFFATEQARRGAHIALVAEIAVQYFNERAVESQLAVARQTLQTVENSLELNRRSFANGVISELDLRTAEAQVQTARGDVASLVQARAQVENALVFLIGQPLPAGLPAPRPLDAHELVLDVPSGLPSDLLLRRPDVVAAEYRLKAANANIGAARAAFFPRILLTGAAGKSSVDLSDLFEGPQTVWSFSPQIIMPIFQGGRNRANLDLAQTLKRIEIADYERTIQNGFREVADALVARAMLVERIEADAGLVRAQQQRFDLAERRYRSGIDSYLNVLSAQQSLYLAQQRLIELRATRLSNLVALYRALGGGWPEQGTAIAATDPR